MFTLADGAVCGLVNVNLLSLTALLKLIEYKTLSEATKEAICLRQADAAQAY